MAQRTIHMLFATKLTDKVDIKDKNRFFIGSILPDAYINHEDRDKTHFIKRIQQLDYKINYIDFGEFYKKYCNKIMSDDLYLGYYAHLIEDAFYRHYLYHEKDYMEKIKFTFDSTQDEVEFFVLEQTKVNGDTYILVTDSEKDDAECMILKDTKEEGEESVYTVVEDDVELEALSKVFEELLEDVDIEM